MITIRELSREDNIVQVLQLCKNFFAEYEKHHDYFFDIDRLTDNDISGKFINSLDSDKSAAIIAVDNNKIVGYSSLVIRPQPDFYKVKTFGAISALMVDKSYRRQEIATKILIESKEFFRKQGIKYFTFYTAPANKDAIGLYDKCGFELLHYSYLGET